MKTTYTVNINGRRVGAIGVMNSFQVEFSMNGDGHSDEEVRIEAYKYAEHIRQFDIIKIDTQSCG